MDSLGHDLLLLMLNLSRIGDRERIVRLFVEALGAAVPGVAVRPLGPGEEGQGEVVEIATPEAEFGRLLVADPGRVLSEKDRARFRNAIRMLAVVLENVSRAERLASENARLDAAVAARTAELRRLAAGLEARVAERTHRLAEANRELEAFAYSVSHDLRAPLRHVQGYLELLRKRLDEDLDARSRTLMETVSSEARRMDTLIEDLLAFSRMGRAELAREGIALGPLVREVIDALAPDAAGREVRWKVGELPTVCGDRAMLRAAFANLLGNALKFTRPRPVAEIEIEAEPTTGEHAVVISVRDNGVGFEMSHARKLFNVFQRLHRPEEFEGTGVGLANVRRIVERHGGQTWAKGEPDRGATFYLTLPTRGPGAQACGAQATTSTG